MKKRKNKICASFLLLFCMIDINNMKTIQEKIEQQRDMIVESKSDELAQMIQSGVDIDEGVIGTLLGGLAGLTAGATIMKAVCKSLGLKEGMLYNLLTSKVICGVAGAALGNKITG